MIRNTFEKSWYVLHTRSRFENVVHDGLQKKSLQAFLPKHRVRSKRRDRKVIIQVPLFPGYVFIESHLQVEEYLEIVKTVGVVRIIGNKEGPVPVPRETIQSLKIMVAANSDIYTGRQFKKGDKVMVTNGPFTGVMGIFVRHKGKDRVIVHLEALGQFAGVDVHKEDIEILPEK